MTFIFAILMVAVALVAVLSGQRKTRHRNAIKDPFLKWADNPHKWRRTFRFERDDVPRLAAALGLEGRFRLSSRHGAPAVHALLYLLYRYGKSHDNLDGEDFFGPDESTIGRVANAIEDYLFAGASTTIQGFHPVLANRERLQYYADCVEARGCPVDNVWGFIDGNLRCFGAFPSMPAVLCRFLT